MAHLRMALLGSFQVWLDSEPVTSFRSDKVRALLAYLALEADRPHTRASLCGLLWPDKSDDAALQNVSQTLRRLRDALGERRGGVSVLRVSHQSIQLTADGADWLDAATVARLATSTNIGDLERAAELYRGELLPGFGLPGCDAFEEWLLHTRERFARLAITALETLTQQLLVSGRYGEAAESARRLLALDLLREDSQRLLMRALGASGDRAAALAAYERWRETMRDELGVEPDPTTVALAEQIRAGADTNLLGRGPGVIVGTSTVLHSAATHRVVNNLPLQLTPFIGRTRELAELAELLRKPETRLITLGGAGGMGKTRLAIELARRSGPAFAGGVCFVALAPVAALDDLPAALLHALDLPPRGDLVVLLRQTLRDRQLLLVMDNLEHLPGAGSLLVELLQAAPQLKILVTSREPLYVRGEQRYVVGGLPYEPEAPGADAAALPAVQLFVQATTRVQPRFRLEADGLASVQRIARLVVGMPLGLELAAAWVELLPLDAIAQQIERRGDFLAVDLHDLPERQRSMRAVFDWSWQLLRLDEQRVFRQLAVFRGGFTLEAAEIVIGATPALLSRLVEKSLIQTHQRRYVIHELLRQFAQEQLDRDPERPQVKRRYSQLYLGFVAERERRLFRDQPRQAASEINHELDNIRQAWRWAAAHGQARELGRAACTLALFYKLYGATSEWEQLFLLAVTQLREQPGHAAETVLQRQEVSTLLALLGSACLHQGKHTQAHTWAEQAIELGTASGGALGEVHGLLVLGQALRRLGQSERAREVLERAAALAQLRQQDGSFSEQLPDTEFVAYNWLCSIALTGHEYAAAAEYVERGMDICRRLRKNVGITALHSDMVDIAFATGDYVAARGHGEEALRLARGLGYRHIEGTMLCTLSSLARLRGEYPLALDLAAQALLCFQRLGNLVWEVIAANELGYVCLLLGDYAGAQVWLDHADEVLRAADMPPEEASQNALRRAQLAYARGDDAHALVWVTQALEMAQGVRGASVRIQALTALGSIQARLGQPDLAALAFEQALAQADERGQGALVAMARAGLAELACAHGDLGTAMAHGEVLWQILVVEKAQLDEPFGPYLACYRVLAASSDPRAAVLLQQARRMREQYLCRIADPALRESFLTHIACYRELTEEADGTRAPASH
ncbi:MAG: tetratricopeptide repeat protein [Chloroflexales bacterium]|nr:tetratricopeptide repeat protein [Chloroflexales bacterium]